jgi:hypothetical protein
MDYAPSLDLECGDGTESRNATDVHGERDARFKRLRLSEFQKDGDDCKEESYASNALVHGYDKRLNLTLVHKYKLGVA